MARTKLGERLSFLARQTAGMPTTAPAEGAAPAAAPPRARAPGTPARPAGVSAGGGGDAERKRAKPVERYKVRRGARVPPDAARAQRPCPQRPAWRGPSAPPRLTTLCACLCRQSHNKLRDCTARDYKARVPGDSARAPPAKAALPAVRTVDAPAPKSTAAASPSPAVSAAAPAGGGAADKAGRLGGGGCLPAAALLVATGCGTAAF